MYLYFELFDCNVHIDAKHNIKIKFIKKVIVLCI